MGMRPDQSPPPWTARSWFNKFRWAGRGFMVGIRGQASFAVHFAIGAVVLLLAAILRVEPWQWCVLVLCIGIVLSMELFNTVIERLVRFVHPAHDPEIGALLDIAAGAVLVAAIAAAVCGCIVLLPELWRVFVT